MVRIMAIPAHVTFVMRAEIYPGYLFGAIGVFIVALPAELPVHGLFRQRETGSGKMFPGNVVAGGAFQGFVRRYFLGVRYLPVTGAAFFRRMGQDRIMRIMAGHAGLAGIMKLGYYLRKTGGSRRVVAVA